MEQQREFSKILLVGEFVEVSKRLQKEFRSTTELFQGCPVFGSLQGTLGDLEYVSMNFNLT
jgi:hypothetical protein